MSVEERNESLKALSSDDALVRQMGAMRLASIAQDDASVDEALLGAVADADREVRRAACNALIHRDPNRDVSTLLAAIRHVANPTALVNEAPTVSEIAEYGLARLRGLDIAGILLPATNDADPGVRVSALSSIAQTKDPRALAALTEGSRDHNAAVRAAAARGLLRFGETARTQLTRLLAADPAPLVRSAAAAALGSIGGPDSQRALAAARSDPDLSVQKAVEGALKEIDTRAPS